MAKTLLLWVGVIVASGLWLELVLLWRETAPLIPLALVGLIGGALLMWQVVHGKRWAVIALAAISIFILAGNFRQRHAGDVGADWQIAMKAIFWCSYLLVSICNFRRIAGYFTDPAIFCFSLYLLMALLGVSYSEAPMLSFEAVVVIVAYLLFAFFVVEVLSERDVMLLFIYTLAAFCLASFIVALIDPKLAYPQDVGLDETEDDLSRLQGLTAHPNSLGSFAAMMMTFLIGAVYLGYMRRLVWLSVGMIGVATVFAAQSRTPVLALVVASVFQIPRRFLLPLLAIGGMFAVIVSMSGSTTEIYRLLGRGGSAQEAETMSGRTELWAFTEELIAKRPLLGYGFQSFEVYAPTQWTGETRSDVVGPHNNYLNLLYNGGIIGAVPFVVTFLILLARWWTTPFLPRDLYVFSVLVTSYAEADLPNNAVVPTLSFFLILALDARRRAAVQGRVVRLRQFLVDWQRNMAR